ncbi:glycosyltransferase family 39 protein [uncultured Streptomyces sp.]|uniref:glycosyltransferase family 39 protein n=1 Tax=uncultured Streptomyces sp. TaxID=174707 RepID=UPI002633BFDE|nr:glycosyltransferase family 39 protein [uncultured Streptomyces sp.]
MSAAARETAEVPATSPHPPRRRFRRHVPAAAWAVILYAAVRATSLAALALWCRSTGKSPRVLLSERWDSLWYVRVAAHGYDFTLTAPDGRSLPSTAFFPLLPWLETGVHRATGVGLPTAGLLVGAVASLLAAWGIFHVVRTGHGDRAGVVCVVLWAAVPVGIVQSMAYSEALFVALAAWALHAVLTRRLLLAGTLACLAGLTRPVGLAVTAALLLAVWQLGRRGGLRTAQQRLTALLACLIAPTGAVTYILWVGERQGNPLGYLDVQASWGNGFDGGWAFATFLTGGLSPWLSAGTLLLLLALATWPHIPAKSRPQPAPVLLYSAIVTLLALGASGYFGSKPRLLLPAFPLLVPLAVALARRRPRVLYATLIPLTLASAAYGAFWLNGSGPP